MVDYLSMRNFGYGANSGWAGVPYKPDVMAGMDWSGAVDTTANAAAPQAAQALGTGGSHSWMDPVSIFGGTRGDGSSAVGWGTTALNLGQSLLGGYLGMKQYGLGQERLAEAKRQFDVNASMQRKTVNTALEDRQRARVASNPGAYQSVGAYMKKHGV